MIVGAAVAFDHGNAGALAPDVQLLDGGGAEGVCAADHHVLARVCLGARDLADRRGLAGAVDADEQHAARGTDEDVALGLDEELAQALGEGGAQLIGGREVLPRRGLAQVVGHAHGDLAAHVAHDARVLELLPDALVNLAAEREDLIQGLAAALQTALERIEQTHYAFTTFPVSRSSF